MARFVAMLQRRHQQYNGRAINLTFIDAVDIYPLDPIAGTPLT